jgi:hypothetical protein
LADVHQTTEGAHLLRWRDALPDTETTYLFDSPADAVYARRNGKQIDAVLLDRSGKRLRDADPAFLESLMSVEPFESVGSVGFGFGQEWVGRVFIFDPQRIGDPEEELRFAEFAGSPGFITYLMRRLRERRRGERPGSHGVARWRNPVTDRG